MDTAFAKKPRLAVEIEVERNSPFRPTFNNFKGRCVGDFHALNFRFLNRLKLSDFNYNLPQHLIAQHPAECREGSRLLIYHRTNGLIRHARFLDLLEELRSGDLLVVNDSRVIPARLRGSKPTTGGAFEVLLIEEIKENEWWAMVRPSKRLVIGGCIDLHRLDGTKAGIQVELLEKTDTGLCRLQFLLERNIFEVLPELGEIPLPPYIKRPKGKTGSQDVERYQTVYAQVNGSVAAPTAGLHFTPTILDDLKTRGIRVAPVTLHVGAGTFAPVKVSAIEEHQMHSERFFLPMETLAEIQKCRLDGGRVVAVGTTSLRVLESAANIGLEQAAGRWQQTQLFVYPPHEFSLVDAMLTNFHLPESTLLMLVSAFIDPGRAEGREKCLAAYEEAIRQGYRFFSYGDAMFIS